MDALFAAAVDAAAGEPPTIVILPVAAARQRPDLAATHGEHAFRAASARVGRDVRTATARVLTPEAAADPDACAMLEHAHLVHLPGGDPDVVAGVLGGTLAWAAILRAHERGACIAGASAGAMALAGRLWTRDGPAAGLGLLPGLAVVPHYSPARLESWRRIVEADEPLTWVGLDEQTLAIGRPGGEWAVAGTGRTWLIPPGAPGPVSSAGHGERFDFG